MHNKNNLQRFLRYAGQWVSCGWRMQIDAISQLDLRLKGLDRLTTILLTDDVRCGNINT